MLNNRMVNYPISMIGMSFLSFWRFLEISEPPRAQEPKSPIQDGSTRYDECKAIMKHEGKMGGIHRNGGWGEIECDIKMNNGDLSIYLRLSKIIQANDVSLIMCLSQKATSPRDPW